MIKAVRHDRILAEIAKRGAISVQELADLLDASTATIRRDISELDDSGTVLRTHGGATLRSGNEELPYDAKVMAFLPEKRRIGATAAAMLKPNLSIGLGGGTTVMQLVGAIKRQKLHVTTTAINVALELRDAPDIDVLLTGGVLRSRTAETVGHVAERTLNDINLDIAIIGIDGLHPVGGLTTYDSAEAYVNRVMLARAREIWVLADHSKIGQIRPAIVSGITAGQTLITDGALSKEWAATLETAGMTIIRA
ncbi:MAG: transcriptional regulator, DeoR family [Devosia sp.]|nr:transcriptional regulator, DeoR family [Devosia sp.]